MVLLISIIVLGILIFVHELGHFLLAKFFGVGVVEFAIGFGKKIWKTRVGDTTYSLGIIPLGGYVRMVGDDPRALDQAPEAPSEELSEDEKFERELLADKNRWFLNKGFWPKSIIVLAGPGFNVLFAFFLSVVSVYYFGLAVPINEPIIGSMMPDYPAAKAGLKEGDRILSIDGQALKTWEEMSILVSASDGKALTVLAKRKDESGVEQELTLSLTPELEGADLALINNSPEESSPGVKRKQPFRIGIMPAHKWEVTTSPWEALEIGFYQTISVMELTVRGLRALVMGAISPKNIGGPIQIFTEAGASARKGSPYLFNFMIFLSINLAILNLLPIPILDGGHLLFFLVGAIKGRPVSLRVQEFATQMGMAFLLLLMLFAFWNDINRLVQ